MSKARWRASSCDGRSTGSSGAGSGAMGGGGDDDGIAASLNGRERRHKSMPQRARVGANLQCAVRVLQMCFTSGHTSGGEDHSLWSYYSEEAEEGRRERKLGPALRILLIRFPNLRSLMSRT